MKKVVTIIIVLSSFYSCVKSQGILGIQVGTSDLPANPSLLTWTKVHEERFFNLVDENHIHYASDFSVSTSNLTAVSGSTPSISGGNLVVGGSAKYKSTSNPLAAWTTIEMTIASMGSAGDSNKIGAMLIKDATHYIAAAYDNVTDRFQIIQNDTVLFSTAVTVNTTGLKLYLVMSGYTATLWFQEAGEDLVCGFALLPHFDFRSIDITEYKYGVYCLQSGGTTTHNISSLRGSASGGVSFFNNKIVRNYDGSDFIRDGKLIMTADLTNPSANGGIQWTDANSVVLAIDTATYSIEIIGRFYFDRSSKRLGGQDLHIIWDESQNKWLVNYVPADNTGLAEHSDFYFYLDSTDLYTEVVIPEVDLTEITFNAGGEYYDVSTRIIDGEYVAAPGKSFSAFIFSGDYSSMGLVSEFSNEFSWECGQWYHYNGQWYISYSSFGDTRQVVLSYPDLNLIGYMNLPFITSSFIPGYDWYCKQVNGRTTYNMIGFDTERWTTTIPNYGVVTWPWTMGNLVVWRAAQTKMGNEF